MNLIQEAKNRLAVLVRGLPPVPTDTGKGSVYADLSAMLTRSFAVDYERTQIHRDIHRMDRDDEIVHFAFTTIASRAMGYPDPTVNSFNITAEDREPASEGESVRSETAKRAQVIIEDLIDRVGLRPAAWQVVRRGVKWGNEFREILYEKQGDQYKRIAGLKPLPEHTVWPNTNERGDRLLGYAQRMENMPRGVNEIRLEEYEIVHFLFGEEDGYLGTPLLACARRNWNRLNLAEDSAAVARLVRAYVKFLHLVPVNKDDPKEKQLETIKRYIDAMTKIPQWTSDIESLTYEKSPSEVKTNFFLPDDGSKRGGITMLDPANSQLQNITDLEYFLRRVITATTVPFRYFPFEGSTPKLSEGGGTAEDVNFACTLLMCHQMLQEGYNKLFSIELLLQGIDPRQLRFVYRMADLNIVDLLRAAQRDLALSRALGELVKVMPGLVDRPEVILREYTSMSDVSITKLLADDKLTEGAREGLETGGNGKTRIQLPGTGVGEEARSLE